MSLTFEELHQQVGALIAGNARHTKRGWRIQDVTLAECTNHMLEEAVEVQAEALDPRCLTEPSPWRTNLIKELADLQAIVAHIMHKTNIPPQTVMRFASTKLDAVFEYPDIRTSGTAEHQFDRDGFYATEKLDLERNEP